MKTTQGNSPGRKPLIITFALKQRSRLAPNFTYVLLKSLRLYGVSTYVTDHKVEVFPARTVTIDRHLWKGRVKDEFTKMADKTYSDK